MPNRPECYANKNRYNKTRYEQRKRYYQKTQNYASKRWTDEEDILVMKHELSDVELSEKLRRSVGAIQARRYTLRKRKQYLEV